MHGLSFSTLGVAKYLAPQPQIVGVSTELTGVGCCRSCNRSYKGSWEFQAMRGSQGHSRYRLSDRNSAQQCTCPCCSCTVFCNPRGVSLFNRANLVYVATVQGINPAAQGINLATLKVRAISICCYMFRQSHRWLFCVLQ